MEQTYLHLESFAQLLDASDRPVYAIDAERKVVLCNAALAAWLGLEVGQIVGRSVEYHSESSTALTDLCPPPAAFAGVPSVGTIGCVARSGRLVHRRADFLPLPVGDKPSCGVLGLVAAADMSPQELAASLSDEPAADELHRAIRRFRRNQAAEHALETLLGEGAAMRRVQAQVAAATASSANVLIRGRRGTGREHVARAIHYQTADSGGKLVPIDCQLANEDSLRRGIESIRGSHEPKACSMLLLLNVEHLALQLQAELLPIVSNPPPNSRVVATLATNTTPAAAADVDPQLIAALSTITIELPSLADRREDLPLLVQYFLEASNRGSEKQIGSVRPDALDLLALYRWPGELDELRGVIAAAHAAATSCEVTPADLPAIVHHAAKAANMPRREPEKIVLDELLSRIEREVIVRAMAQAGGNKSAAAELLGMTRPRLYRRLVQLGLVNAAVESESQ